jgi:cytosine/adenosine deaminase-related metal-dependent hydrolase
MTEEETCALAASGAVAGLCPITEANLGDGIFDGSRYLESGGLFGVGSDSNVLISLTGELRQLEYSQRLSHRKRNVMVSDRPSTGYSLYRSVLAGSARALGRNAGAIETGRLADLVAIDTSCLALAGLRETQLLDGWIFASNDNAVTDVWSAGRHCVEGGRHVARDSVEAAFRQVQDQLRERL